MKRWNAALAKRKLDKLWSQYIHKRDNHCRFCGRTEGVANAHHIYSRSHLATRWNILNGLRVCFTCHRGSHDDIPWGYDKTLEAIGEWQMTMLANHSRKIVHFDRAFYATKLIELQNLCKSLD